MKRSPTAILRRNLQVGPYAPVTIRAAESQGATARAIDELRLSRLSLAGADATPGQLIELAQIPAPPEPPDRGEPPFGTTWAYLDSQDEQDAYIEPTEDDKAAEYEAERAAEYAAFTDGEVNADERSIEYEDYREGLYPSWVRPGYVDWKREAE